MMLHKTGRSRLLAAAAIACAAIALVVWAAHTQPLSADSKDPPPEAGSYHGQNNVLDVYVGETGSYTWRYGDYWYWYEWDYPALEQVSPTPTVYTWLDDFYTMQYSGSGDVTADLEPVNLMLPPGPNPDDSDSGCEAADFAGFTPGNIALIQRGTCTFALKAQNAEAAGAVGVIIFNEGQPGRTDVLAGDLGGPVVDIPVVGTSFAVGDELASAVDPVVRMYVLADTYPGWDAIYEERYSLWYSGGIHKSSGFTIEDYFGTDLNDPDKTAVLQSGDIEITRSVSVPSGDAPFFTISYVLENTGTSPLTDVRLFETVDYDIADGDFYYDDASYYAPTDFVLAEDWYYYQAGFTGDRASNDHGVGSYGEMTTDDDDGDLNGVNSYSNDVAVAMQYNVGDLAAGESWDITLAFWFGDPNGYFGDPTALPPEADFRVVDQYVVADLDCPSAHCWINGSCVPCDDPCVDDADCSLGESCRNGWCTPCGISCAEVVCPPGQCCLDGYCFPCDMPCVDDADCSAGESCVGGYCVLTETPCDQPGEIAPSEDVSIMLDKVIHNNGPWEGVEAYTETIVTPPDGCTVRPEVHIEQFHNVPVSVDILHHEPFTIHCEELGEYTFEFDDAIHVSVIPGMVDPDPGNNGALTELTVTAVGEADVKITSAAFLPPPSKVTLGEPTDVTLRKHIHNNGPSEPVDISISSSATPAPGCTIVPKTVPTSVSAVPISIDQVIDEVWTITCTEEGLKTFIFDNSIDVATPYVSDPDPTNNSSHKMLSVMDDPDPDADTDLDGLCDACEPCPVNPDCDDDGVSDGPSDPDGDGPIVAGPDNCPAVPNTDQADFDGDGVGDACDDSDADGDGFSDTIELYVGTDPLDACADDPSDAAWPLDIDMDGGLSVTGDIHEYSGRIGTAADSPEWWTRLDLDASGDISVTGDVAMYRGRLGETCT